MAQEPDRTEQPAFCVDCCLFVSFPFFTSSLLPVPLNPDDVLRISDVG